MANESVLSCEVCTIITKDLGVWKICEKMILRLLNEEQQEGCVQLCVSATRSRIELTGESNRR